MNADHLLLQRIQSRVNDLGASRVVEPVQPHSKFDPLKRQVAFGPEKESK